MYGVYGFIVNNKEIIKLLTKEGFTLVKVSGDHHKFRHEDGRIVIVPHPKKDLPIGTARNIFRQAGLKWR